VLAVSAGVAREPVTVCIPDQPPEAVQAVAFAEDHVRVAVAPLFKLLGDADKLTVGVAALTETVADWVALAPEPVQVSK
jgi:hypothetical protein